MAVAYITEFVQMEQDEYGRPMQVALYPPLAKQKVDFATAKASAAFNARTRMIRVYVDTKAHFDIGASPTATTDDELINADAPEYFGVVAGHAIHFRSA